MRRRNLLPPYGVVTLAGFAVGSEAGDLPCTTSSTTLAARSRLVGHALSLIRHSASVIQQPQVQGSAFNLCKATFFCSGVKCERSTPGSSVALTAFDKNT
jgi:hypothetical protein